MKIFENTYGLPLKEGSVRLHTCYPKRILLLPIQFHPCRQHCSPHTSSSSRHPWHGKAMLQPTGAHPLQQEI